MTGLKDNIHHNHYLYFIASLVILLLGIGHILIELLSWYLLGPPDPKVFTVMLNHRISIFGMDRSLWEFMKGFSLTMGTLMVGYSIFNLLLWKRSRNIIKQNYWLSLSNAVLCLVVGVLSVIYFHWPPIIGFFISAILYFAEYVNAYAAGSNKK